MYVIDVQFIYVCQCRIQKWLYWLLGRGSTGVGPDWLKVHGSGLLTDFNRTQFCGMIDFRPRTNRLHIATDLDGLGSRIDFSTSPSGVAWKSGREPISSLSSPPNSHPIPPPFPSLPLPSPPLRSNSHIVAKGSGGALKLPQQVRTEPGRQTVFGAF